MIKDKIMQMKPIIRQCKIELLYAEYLLSEDHPVKAHAHLVKVLNFINFGKVHLSAKQKKNKPDVKFVNC